MSLASEAKAAPAPVFSPRAVLALVLVGLFAFSAFAVLSAYAPELRGGNDGGTHALSRSAVGFAGAVALLKAEGVPVLISRAPDQRSTRGSLVVLTPSPANDADDLNRLASRKVTLIVLPKWSTEPEPLRPGWVGKAGLGYSGAAAARLLAPLAKSTDLATRPGASRPVLSLAPDVRVATPEGRRVQLGALRPGPVDRLQTLSGEGWSPIVIDEAGRIVLAASTARPDTYVLADPDLLNTQGLAALDTARTATALIAALRSDRDAVVFDVTLQGYGRSRSLGKLMLEPPILGATLCAVAAALLMGWHALARFGPTPPPERAFALGARALVDNSADLVRMGRKEHELARPYAALIETLAARAAGEGRGAGAERLDRLEGQRRTTSSRRDLEQASAAVETPADLLAAARRWRLWKSEMTRDRR